MDLPAALRQVPSEMILCGNLAPAKIFVNSTPAEVAEAVRQLREATRAFPNFVLSAGCNVPPGTKPENIAASYEAFR